MTTSAPSTDELLAAARRYAAAGLACIPKRPGLKRDDFDKLRATGSVNWLGVPHISAFQRRLPTDDELASWFATPSNLGIVPGHDNVIVLDFDDEAAYLRWSRANPEIAERTPTQRSPNGYHVFLRPTRRVYSAKIVDGGAHCGEVLAGEIGVCVWPSVHPSGATYAWLDDRAPWECEIATIESLDGMGIQVTECRTPAYRMYLIMRTIVGGPRHVWRRIIYHAPRMPIVHRFVSSWRRVE